MSNKIFSILACIVLAATAGCSGPLADDGKDIVLEGYTLLNGAMEALSLPGYDTSEKLWKKGDKLGLYSDHGQVNIEWNIRKTSEGMENAEFYGKAISGNLIAGYYPYGPSKRGDINGIPCTLPTVQRYTPGLSAAEYLIENTECIHASLKDSALHFSYPFGLLNVDFDLYEQLPLTSLSIVSDSTIISGLLKIAHDGKVIREYPGKQYVDIDLGDAAIRTDAIAQAKGIHILMPPALYDDLRIVIKTQDGKKMSFNIPELEVKRIEKDVFTVQTVTIATTGTDILEQTDGYLEPTDYVVRVFELSYKDTSLEQTDGYLEPNETDE